MESGTVHPCFLGLLLCDGWDSPEVVPVKSSIMGKLTGLGYLMDWGGRFLLYPLQVHSVAQSVGAWRLLSQAYVVLATSQHYFLGWERKIREAEYSCSDATRLDDYVYSAAVGLDDWARRAATGPEGWVYWAATRSDDWVCLLRHLTLPATGSFRFWESQ